HCVRCHGEAKPRGGLRLDTAKALARGGKSGPGFEAGEGADSQIVLALRGEGTGERMPLKRPPLADKDIDAIPRRIDQGAKAPAEVEAFEKDDRPDAYDRLVDRLLASPHYGERWGRLWLDGARYADSNGYSIDAPRVIWPYRDWVINAFNQDQTFDEFTIDQL